jgi:hypothetical protein
MHTPVHGIVGVLLQAMAVGTLRIWKVVDVMFKEIIYTPPVDFACKCGRVEHTCGILRIQ